jgi:hypothetical protein
MRTISVTLTPFASVLTIDLMAFELAEKIGVNDARLPLFNNRIHRNFVKISGKPNEE